MNIKEFKNKYNVTTVDIAVMSDLSYLNVYRYENGLHTPHKTNMKKLIKGMSIIKYNHLKNIEKNIDCDSFLKDKKPLRYYIKKLLTFIGL